VWKLPAVVRNRVLARQLARDPGYSFTADYVSSVQSSWQGLLEELRGRPNLRVLEIGSYEGRSAIWFLENVVTDPSATLTCVDPWWWREDELRFDHNLLVSGHAARVTKLKGPSDEVLPPLPHDSFDLIYVDGSHRAMNVLMDGALAWQRVKPGGMVIFDDYRWDPHKPAHERPEPAIDLLLELLDGRHELLLKEYQLAIRKRA
jgi:predicted O-methyltransferase YrrM